MSLLLAPPPRELGVRVGGRVSASAWSSASLLLPHQGGSPSGEALSRGHTWAWGLGSNTEMITSDLEDHTGAHGLPESLFFQKAGKTQQRDCVGTEGLCVLWKKWTEWQE